VNNINEEDNELIKINNYLEKYFENWLINDIDLIRNCSSEENKLYFTLPYVLLVHAGIDFLGGLICGFKRNNRSNSHERSVEFIKKYMGDVDPVYRENNMANFLYENVRNGAVHCAMYKKNASCTTDPNGYYPKENHLYVNIDNKIIIQVSQFIDDFKEAYKRFKEKYIKKYYKNAHKNLIEMLEDSKDFENLINCLKQNHRIYYPEVEIDISPSQVDSISSSIKIYNSSSTAPPIPSEAVPKEKFQ